MGQCENVGWVFTCVSLQARRTSSDLALKAGYLKCVPWIVSEASDPEMARECCDQLLAIGDEPKLTPF